MVLLDILSGPFTHLNIFIIRKDEFKRIDKTLEVAVTTDATVIFVQKSIRIDIKRQNCSAGFARLNKSVGKSFRIAGIDKDFSSLEIIEDF